MVGGFVGCGGKVDFGISNFLGLIFLDVVARPLWVSRDRVPPVLIKICRFLSGWGFLLFRLVSLGFLFLDFSSLGGINLGNLWMILSIECLY